MLQPEKNCFVLLLLCFISKQLSEQHMIIACFSFKQTRLFVVCGE